MFVRSFVCPHCGHENTAFEMRWLNDPGDGAVLGAMGRGSPIRYKSVWECQHCFKLLCAHFETKTDLRKVKVLPNDAKFIYTYPKSTKAEAPEHTPENVARFYLQGLAAFKRLDYDACGAMMRKAVDVATKLLGYEDQTLYNRIDALHKSGALTEALAKWAHQVRDIGNVAVHEEQPFSKEEADDITVFTEMFLLYLFTMPYKVNERLQKKTGGQASASGSHT